VLLLLLVKLVVTFYFKSPNSGGHECLGLVLYAHLHTFVASYFTPARNADSHFLESFFSSAFFLRLLSRTRRRASLAFRVVVVVPALYSALDTHAKSVAGGASSDW